MRSETFCRQYCVERWQCSLKVSILDLWEQQAPSEKMSGHRCSSTSSCLPASSGDLPWLTEYRHIAAR